MKTKEVKSPEDYMPEIWHDGCNYLFRYEKHYKNGLDLERFDSIIPLRLGFYCPGEICPGVTVFCPARFYFSDDKFIEVYYAPFEKNPLIDIGVYVPVPGVQVYKNEIRPLTTICMTYPEGYKSILDGSSEICQDFPDKSPQAIERLHLFFERVQDVISELIESDFKLPRAMFWMDVEGKTNS